MLVIPNGQAAGSELSSSKLTAIRLVRVKLKYICYVTEILSCGYSAEVDGKFVMGRLKRDEYELLSSLWDCDLMDDGTVFACISVRKPESAPRHDIRTLALWYKNRLISCSCIYKDDPLESARAKSCECESWVMMS
jgi:hypothetical protein